MSKVRSLPGLHSLMKIAILYKEENRKAQELFGQVKKYLASRKVEVVPLEKADFIITLGGDGALIHSACKYAAVNVPLLGINTGNLGFLTAAEAGDWKKAIDKLLAGKIFVSERIMLEAHVGGKTFIAVNEAVIRSQFRVVDLDISVSGEPFLKVVGDGVIVATQTGSTAYSLSAGGSIVDSDLNCFLVTPINPIGLPVPSIVLSPDEEMRIKVTGGDEITLVVDGQAHAKLSMNSEVVIKRGKNNIKFAYFDRKHFLKSLNAKFGLAGRTVRK